MSSFRLVGDLNSFLQVYFRPNSIYVNLHLDPSFSLNSALQRAIPDKKDLIFLVIPHEFCLPSLKRSYTFQPWCFISNTKKSKGLMQRKNPNQTQNTSTHYERLVTVKQYRNTQGKIKLCESIIAGKLWKFTAVRAGKISLQRFNRNHVYARRK